MGFPGYNLKQMLRAKRDNRGSLILVMPMLLALLFAGALSWNLQNAGRAQLKTGNANADAKRLAYNVMQRVKAVLLTPGQNSGTNNCGSPAVAGTINNSLAAFRNLAVATPPVTFSWVNGGPVTLLRNSCLLPAYETGWSWIDTVDVTVTQIAPPDVVALSSQIGINVQVRAKALDQSVAESVATLSETATLKVASPSQYVLIFKNTTSSVPNIQVDPGVKLIVKSDAFHASNSATRVQLAQLVNATDGRIIFERPLQMRGRAIQPPAATLDASLITNVFTKGYKTRIFDSQSVSGNNFPTSDTGPTGTAWNQQLTWIWTNVNTRIEPKVNVKLAAGGEPWAPGTTYNQTISISPPPLITSIPDAAANQAWINPLNTSCDPRRSAPMFTFLRGGTDLTIGNATSNMNGGTNGILCGLISARRVTFNVVPGTTNYFVGVLIAEQVNVRGGGTLIMINPFDAAVASIPTTYFPVGTQTASNLASQFQDMDKLWGRNFFVPAFRVYPGLLDRSARLRPTGASSIKIGAAYAVGGTDLLVPGYKWPCVARNANLNYASNAACSGAWNPADPLYNTAISPTTAGTAALNTADLFTPFRDNLVFTYSSE